MTVSREPPGGKFVGIHQVSLFSAQFNHEFIRGRGRIEYLYAAHANTYSIKFHSFHTCHPPIPRPVPPVPLPVYSFPR